MGFIFCAKIMIISHISKYIVIKNGIVPNKMKQKIVVQSVEVPILCDILIEMRVKKGLFSSKIRKSDKNIWSGKKKALSLHPLKQRNGTLRDTRLSSSDDL